MSAVKAKPRLALAGTLTTREKLWAAMRVLKQFTVPELARAAKVDRHAYYMSDYITGLVRAGNVCGAQFHPEKSGAVGLGMLKAFAEEGAEC